MLITAGISALFAGVVASFITLGVEKLGGAVGGVMGWDSLGYAKLNV